MITFLYLITIILCYLLFRILIIWYFKAKKGRYSIESNYLFKYSIGILFSAFCIINPKLTPYLINWFIININKRFKTDILTFDTSLDLYSLILYALLCISVIILLITAFKSRRQKAIETFITRKENLNSEKKELLFPEDNFKESPILHERLKRYFELKYKKKGLVLDVSTKDKLIYGKYNEGFRNYFIAIKYDENELENIITRELQHQRLIEIKEIKSKIISKHDEKDYLCDYYYIIGKGKFEKNSNIDIHTKTEDDILNELIDFKMYLKSLISKFHNDKIFSAIAKESEKKTLSETFIMPSYKLENEENSNLNLEDYVTHWLKNSPVHKHLTLLGDYGMGKTSFLKFYSNKLANEILNNEEIIRYPVFISLNNTSPRHGGIKKTISAFVAENLGVDYELFEILIHKGKILFLLDAFDEMGFVGTHDDRFKQINEIWKLAFKNNKILLSGRASYFPSDFELKQTLNIISKEDEVIQTQPYCSSIRLELLNESQIKNYISKYFKEERSLQFFKWLENSPSILELCKRPSLMHIIREMLPNLHRKDSKEITTPGNAIEKYIDYWINRQVSKNIQSAFSNDIKKRKFIKSFFRHIAIHIFQSKQYKVSSEFVKEELHKFIDDYGIANLSKKYQKEGFENEILTAYFIEVENDYFRFVHKSFFEFFVAKEIILLLKNNEFKSKILFEDWSNPIVNFIYDSIPDNFKLNERVPALLLFMKKGSLSNIKNSLTRFYLKYSDNIIGLTIISIFICALTYYFNYTSLSIMKLILYLIPFLIGLLFITMLVLVFLFEFIGKNKNVKFTIKAFKVAFIKKQFGIKNNLDIVLPLLRNNSKPHIPLENIDFDNQMFKDCNFYRLRNVNFENCKFHIPILNRCHLNNVDFKNSKMSNISFNKCRFSDVNFNDLSLIISEKKSKIPQKLKKQKPLLYFNDCNFDDVSLKNLESFINKKGLELGNNIDGCENFRKTINYVS